RRIVRLRPLDLRLLLLGQPLRGSRLIRRKRKSSRLELRDQVGGGAVGKELSLSCSVERRQKSPLGDILQHLRFGHMHTNHQIQLLDRNRRSCERGGNESPEGAGDMEVAEHATVKSINRTCFTPSRADRPCSAHFLFRLEGFLAT